MAIDTTPLPNIHMDLHLREGETEEAAFQRIAEGITKALNTFQMLGEMQSPSPRVTETFRADITRLQEERDAEWARIAAYRRTFRGRVHRKAAAVKRWFTERRQHKLDRMFRRADAYAGKHKLSFSRSNFTYFDMD